VILLSEGNTHKLSPLLSGMGARNNLDLDPNSWTGDSTAKWDGDTLVVDTGRRSTTRAGWMRPGKPHSDELHVVERYSRPDLGHLNLDVSLDRSQGFHPSPTRFKRVFTLAPGWELQEYVCQEILDGR